MVQLGVSFLDILYVELRRTFCSTEQIHLGNFGRGHYDEHFCEIFEFGQVVQVEMSF